MAEKRLKRPRDPLALAKLIGDIATGQVEDREADERDPRAVARGHRGGQIGGPARAEALHKAERSRIARRAARARWSKAKEPAN